MNLTFPLRPTLLGVLFGIGLSAQATTSEPVTVSFDTTPRAGQHQLQTVDMQADTRMYLESTRGATYEQRAKVAKAASAIEKVGPVKMSVQMLQEIQVATADAEGWLPLTATLKFNKGQIEANGKTVPMAQTTGANYSFNARFNPKDFNFEIKQSAGLGAAKSEQMAERSKAVIGTALQLSKALALRPMKVGESVDGPLSLSLPMVLPGNADTMQATAHYTLVRVDEGVAYFDVSMELKQDVDKLVSKSAVGASAAGAAPVPDMHMQMRASGKGTSSLRLADQLPLESQLTMKMTVIVDTAKNSSRMLMDMDIDVRTRGENLAETAPTAARENKKN